MIRHVTEMIGHAQSTGLVRVSQNRVPKRERPQNLLALVGPVGQDRLMDTTNQEKSPLHVRADSAIPTSVSELRLRDFVAMGIGAFIGYLILTNLF